MRRLEDEFAIALFAFLLHFVWEMWQVPFFVGMAEADHWPAVQFCTRAAAGDAVIALVAFWAVAAMWRDRSWPLGPRPPQIALFIAVGLAITIVLEWLATEQWQRWAYVETMPRLPVLGTGLLPLLQWSVVPLVNLWLARRHVIGGVGGR